MAERTEERVAGLLLAAGAGRRMGRPKALVESPDGTPWVVTASRVLRTGGCGHVTVVLGAEAARVAALLAAEPVTPIEAADWDEGMGASLRRGLTHLLEHERDAHAALVHLVDLPDVGDDVVRRITALAAPDVLARASYDGRPGHPVLLGRDHWGAIAEQATGDAGARAYLGARDVTAVECADLAAGRDVDRPPR